MQIIVNVSTGGKLIIAGEHAVMYGYSALSIAINQRVDVEIKTTNEDKVVIFSNVYGNKSFSIRDVKSIFKNNKKLNNEDKWVLPILFLVFKQIQECGVVLNIKSDIDSVGFGSSGAIFSAISCGLLLATSENSKKCKKTFLNHAINMQKEYTHWLRDYEKKDIFMPSGVDLATSIYGGLIFFNGENKKALKISNRLLNKTGVFAIYSGHKTSTDDVMKKIYQNNKRDDCYKRINMLVSNIFYDISNYNVVDKKLLYDFSKNITLNQEILEELNLMDEDMINIISACKKDNVLAKISGSGLGDCVIVFAKYKDIKNKYKHIFELSKKYKIINIKIDNKGLKYKIQRYKNI